MKFRLPKTGSLVATVLCMVLMVSLSSWISKPAPVIPASLKWSERMALSIIKRSPEAYPSWGYTQGLIMYSLEQLWKKDQDKQYLDYILKYADQMVDDEGNIKNYKASDFNIDNINTGKILFNLYNVTKDAKYKKAMHLLRNQLEWQPTTSEGGYWHKLKYPWQMWLDGAYMGSPYLAQYAQTFNDYKAFDKVAHQFILMEKHLRDPKTGLLYHGWDESKIQDWASAETGASPNFWGRAMGWYAMALVDVLDSFPENHPKRQVLIETLQRLSTALLNYQDPKTGLWYQVVDQGSRAGNYQEASASSMFVYAMAKGARKGYLDKKFKKAAEKAYKGIINNMIEVEADGEIHIHQVCEVAGLGFGRDGSYEYYINESKRSDDPKATGPFILASLELNK